MTKRIEMTPELLNRRLGELIPPRMQRGHPSNKLRGAVLAALLRAARLSAKAAKIQRGRAR